MTNVEMTPSRDPPLLRLHYPRIAVDFNDKIGSRNSSARRQPPSFPGCNSHQPNYSGDEFSVGPASVRCPFVTLAGVIHCGASCPQLGTRRRCPRRNGGWSIGLLMATRGVCTSASCRHWHRIGLQRMCGSGPGRRPPWDWDGRESCPKTSVELGNLTPSDKWHWICKNSCLLPVRRRTFYESVNRNVQYLRMAPMRMLATEELPLELCREKPCLSFL